MKIVLIAFYLLMCVPALCAKNKTNLMIGAYYFDGWSGKNYSGESWADSVNAPTGLTYKLMTQFPEREPIWGWRNDDIKIMEQQIDLASANGIDFFVFCWYWSFDGGPISETRIKATVNHTSLDLFLKAKNKTKMKFAILIANHSGSRIIGEANWNVAVEYLAKEYFSDSQYLKIDGKPYLGVFIGGDANEYIPSMNSTARRLGYPSLYLVSCNFHVTSSDFDATSFYNEPTPCGIQKEAVEYSELLPIIEYYWKYQPDNFIPSCIVGYDKRPWFEKEDFIYYVNRKPKVFYQFLKDAAECVEQKSKPHPIIMIYAWNELGEGGYLVPTKGDRNYKYLRQVKRVKKFAKRKGL